MSICSLYQVYLRLLGASPPFLHHEVSQVSHTELELPRPWSVEWRVAREVVPVIPTGEDCVDVSCCFLDLKTYIEKKTCVMGNIMIKLDTHLFRCLGVSDIGFFETIWLNLA